MHPKGCVLPAGRQPQPPPLSGRIARDFLESEPRAFAEKFEAAADRITADLGRLEASLNRSIESMADQLGWADSKLGDTEGALDSVLAYTHTINDNTNEISTRLRALFRQDRRDDPVRSTARKNLLEAVVKQLSEDDGLLKKILAGGGGPVTVSGKAAVELDEAKLGSVLREAVKLATERKESEKEKKKTQKP